MKPPVAKRVPLPRTHHGDTVVDDYEWLRDKSDPEVIAHLEAENAYTEEQLAGLQPLRERIFDEISSRVLQTDLSVPVREGSWWYYTRSIEGKQYGISCRAPVADAGRGAGASPSPAAPSRRCRSPARRAPRSGSAGTYRGSAPRRIRSAPATGRR